LLKHLKTATFLITFLALSLGGPFGTPGALTELIAQGPPSPQAQATAPGDTVKEYRIKDANAPDPEDAPPIIERVVEKPGEEGAAGAPEAPAAPSGTTAAEPSPPKAAQAQADPREKETQAANAQAANTNAASPKAASPKATASPKEVNPGVEITVDNIKDALVFPQNETITYGDSLLVWDNNKLYMQNPDGTRSLLDSSLSVQEDELGQKWLSRDEEGNFLIQVSLKVWATINFEYNSDVILPSSEPILKAFGDALMTPALRDFNLIIAGHTDNIGSHEFNLKLSRGRAVSVAKWLSEKKGVESERMILSGYSYTVPIADNATAEGRAKNRRVEFVLLPSSDP
jgi:outer membrane protein OmpA-like peptidoglycan-associated protein